MKRNSTPDGNGRLSDKRKQEMLGLLFDELDRLHGKKKSKITVLLGYAWRGVAVLFISLCAAWLLIPSRTLFRKNTLVNASNTAADMQNMRIDIPEREKLDMELYEMDKTLEESLSNMVDLIDRDLTGF